MKFKNINFVKYLYLMINVLAVVPILLCFFHPDVRSELTMNSDLRNVFVMYLLLFIALCFISIYVYHKLIKLKSERMISVFIFLLAALPRSLMCFIRIYTPTSDFLNYYLYGIYLNEGKISEISNIIADYQMPKMGGIALFNGLISFIFSPTLLGNQIANVIITSGICVIIYHLIKDYKKEIALIAAVLFAVYPSNIVSSQVTTNSHGATLIFLIALFFLKKSITNMSKKGFFFISLSILFLSISDFIHPSAAIVVIAVLIFLILYILDGWRISSKLATKFTLQCSCYILIIALGFPALNKIGIQTFYTLGIIQDTEQISYLYKIYVGLNQETRGKHGNGEDTFAVRQYTASDQSKATIELIKGRLTDPGAVAKLMIEKTAKAWLTGDTYFHWFPKGLINEYERQKEKSLISDKTYEQNIKELNLHIRGAKAVDTVFIRLLFIFAALGFLLNKHKKPENIINVMTLILLGWVFYIALTEMQQRYRYAAMPSLCILAAVGIYEVIRKTAGSRIFQNKTFKFK